MVEILPFRGVHYSARHLSADVLAPPFDVIEPAQRQQLLDRSPLNAVRITKGPAGHGDDWYDGAAETKSQWLEKGILVRDQAPAFYGYRQTFMLGEESKTRSGFVAAVRLRPWGEGIFPHERTRRGDRADRLKLMRAMQANMSPVFGLYRDAAGDTARILEPPHKPMLQSTDVYGVQQTFWRIQDAGSITRLTRVLETYPVVIADGHHRYETALAYQAERRSLEKAAEATQPYDYVMMYLTRASDEGLVILPTHRLIIQPELDQEGLLNALAGSFDIRPLWDREHPEQALAEAGKDSTAFGLVLPDLGAFVLRLSDPNGVKRAVLDELPDELVHLDVVILQNLILGPHLGISQADLASTDRVEYTIDARQAILSVQNGQAQAAFLLNPTTCEQVWQAATHGVTMPQKSTFFYPKLLTGLVFRPLTGTKEQ